jgi:Holliday junction DNA helicase RuvA
VYHHLSGELRELSLTRAVVEAGGVGYDLRIPLSTYEDIKGRKEVRLLTHLHVREDDLRLYGFGTEEERELFRLLLSVTGVGPSIALAALSALRPAEAAGAIASGDLKTLQRIRGVGRRLAERLVVELRERVASVVTALGEGLSPAGLSRPDGGEGQLTGAAGRKGADAVKALVELGYERKSAQERVSAAYKELLEERKGRPEEGFPTVEGLVRRSLQ